ncbi:hypothetical protein [Streptomyces sp. NPDC048825]|uniref:hypothetical protein n=1 Tax=Streptomyces sp. NPDC048825 TaxID=3365592 RepID=UPI0037124996
MEPADHAVEQIALGGGVPVSVAVAPPAVCRAARSIPDRSRVLPRALSRWQHSWRSVEYALTACRKRLSDWVRAGLAEKDGCQAPARLACLSEFLSIGHIPPL